uniref:Uncharacterized protein n=1 Tax=Caenorhabditis tropicalis TaxID=1561998 RepID=A0A1I7UB45_9PELO
MSSLESDGANAVILRLKTRSLYCDRETTWVYETSIRGATDSHPAAENQWLIFFLRYGIEAKRQKREKDTLEKELLPLCLFLCLPHSSSFLYYH